MAEQPGTQDDSGDGADRFPFRAPPSGPRRAIAAGLVADREVADFRQVGAGQRPGREAADASALYDLTGTGEPDTTIATLAHRRAVAAAVGRHFQR